MEPPASDETNQALNEIRRKLVRRSGGDPEDLEALIAAAEDEIQNLQIALERRTLIARAVGTIMERYELNSIEAFDVLSKLSQETNRKLYDVALSLNGDNDS